MRFIVPYDRNFTEQFFKRSVELFLSREGFELIMREEVDYLAAQFAETAGISSTNTLAFPQLPKNLNILADDAVLSCDRRLLQIAELAANRLLFIEGFSAFGGIHCFKTIKAKARLEPEKPRLHLIKKLYRSSARGSFRSENEKFVLRQLSRSAERWLQLLTLVYGNDYLELLGCRQTFLALPGEK